MAVASYTALIGTSDAIEAHANPDELAKLFAFEKISLASARFDPEELKGLSARLLHKLPYEAVSAPLKALGVEGGPEFWNAVRGNLCGARRCAQVVAHRCRRRQRVQVKTRSSRRRRRRCFHPSRGTTRPGTRGSRALKVATGRKGRALFHPLRLALTGVEDGP